MVAKKSSMRTVVSCSERGACAARGLGGCFGFGGEAIVWGTAVCGTLLDDARDIAEGRRGIGGIGSGAKGSEVVEAREGW